MSVSERLYSHLRQDLIQGLYKRNERLPTRHFLMEKYGVARASIDKAINKLCQEGFLHSRQGSGTFVSGTLPLHPEALSEALSLYVVLNSEVSCMESFFYDQRWEVLLKQRREFSETHIVSNQSIGPIINELNGPSKRVIWSRPSLNCMTYIDRLNYSQTPQIIINRTFPSCNFFSTDTKNGLMVAINAIKTLAKVDKMAMFCPPANPELPFLAEREIAFHEVCIENEIDRSRIFRAKDPSSRYFIQAAQELFKTDFSVVFASDYESVPYLVSSAQQMGRSLGEDLFIITLDWQDNRRPSRGIFCLSQDWEQMFKLSLEWAAQHRPTPHQQLISPVLSYLK